MTADGVTFALVPGAGGDAGYWSELVPELQARGHRALAIDIREDDPALGLPEYARIAEDAIGDRRDVVVVAQSMGAFTAPMLRLPQAPRMIVLLNPMTPVPGETPGEWWEATGQPAAFDEAARAGGRPLGFDLDRVFLHDLPAPVKARLLAGGDREPSGTPFGQPCTFERWPDVPLRVVVGRDDRLFPLAFQRRVVGERLGREVDEIAGGHLAALSNPRELAHRLSDYLVHD